jgi:plastocyanin
VTYARLIVLPAILATIVLPWKPAPANAAQPAAAAVWDVNILPEDQNGQARYSPATVTIAAGDSILWTSRDSADLHNVNISSLGHDGDELKNGESDLVTFTIAGTYSYVCDPHPYMRGKVIVTEANRAYLPVGAVKLSASW